MFLVNYSLLAIFFLTIDYTITQKMYLQRLRDIANRCYADEVFYKVDGCNSCFCESPDVLTCTVMKCQPGTQEKDKEFKMIRLEVTGCVRGEVTQLNKCVACDCLGPEMLHCTMTPDCTDSVDFSKLKFTQMSYPIDYMYYWY